MQETKDPMTLRNRRRREERRAVAGLGHMHKAVTANHAFCRRMPKRQQKAMQLQAGVRPKGGWGFVGGRWATIKAAGLVLGGAGRKK